MNNKNRVIFVSICIIKWKALYIIVDLCYMPISSDDIENVTGYLSRHSISIYFIG